MKTKINHHNVKVGDLFRSTWGYNTTHHDWYEVVATTPAGVRVRELLKNKDSDDGNNGFTPLVWPATGDHRFAGPVKFKRVRPTYDGGYAFKVNSYSSAYSDDGTPRRENHLD